MGFLADAKAADTLVVFADNEPKWGEDVSVEEEFRIGDPGGTDENQLGAVRDMAVRRDGTMFVYFVYDEKAPVIREFDSKGRHVRDVGRYGRAPGEFRQIHGMAVLRNGHLAVWDPENRRITIFDSDGNLEESHKIDSGFHGPDAFFVDRAGNYHVKMFLIGPDGPSLSAGHAPATAFYRITRQGHFAGSTQLPQQEPAAYTLATTQGYRTAFSDAVCYTFNEHGSLLEAHNRQYAISIRLPDGRARRILRTRGKVVELEEGERQQWEAAARRFGRDSGALPATKPVFRRLSVDMDGRIWIDRYVEAVEYDRSPEESDDSGNARKVWREPPTFDVMQQDGVFLGTVVLPGNTYMFTSQGAQVWGVHTREFGESYVVRSRIVHDGGGNR